MVMTMLGVDQVGILHCFGVGDWANVAVSNLGCHYFFVQTF
jgi:hypothetical protein